MNFLIALYTLCEQLFYSYDRNEIQDGSKAREKWQTAI